MRFVLAGLLSVWAVGCAVDEQEVTAKAKAAAHHQAGADQRTFGVTNTYEGPCHEDIGAALVPRGAEGCTITSQIFERGVCHQELSCKHARGG